MIQWIWAGVIVGVTVAGTYVAAMTKIVSSHSRLAAAAERIADALERPPH